MVESICHSQVFDNSQRNSLRGVITGSLSVVPLLCVARRRSIRVESSCDTTVLYPLTLPSGMERCVSAYGSHSLFSARHTSHSCSFSSVLCVCQFLLFFLSTVCMPIQYPLSYSAAVTLGLYCNRSVERIKGNQATFDNSQRNNLRSCLWVFSLSGC